MIIIMSHGVGEDEIRGVVVRLEERGFRAHLSRGVERTIIGAIGDETKLRGMALEALPGVESVVAILQPYKMASRSFKQEDTVVRIGDVEIGGTAIQVMAGPCAVESKEQLFEAAEHVKARGANLLRGGAYK
ncbi:MAG: 3-deoxy-7-phosphoheptulonate synthase, partial [Bacillota bacterium]|nr:3-deoxy-7-phosphoheptulonate synthase [Bacillota bacterium]